MRCVSIRPTNEEELYTDYEAAHKASDLVEVRIDGFSEIPWNAIEKVVRRGPTLLKPSKDSDIERLASLKPEYLDIPIESTQRYKSVRIIASYHNFDETPKDLEEIVSRLDAAPAYALKLVTHAQCGLDGLRMLALLKKMSPKKRISCFCMGDKGQFTRTLAPIYGAFLGYYSLPNKPTAPGQLSIDAPRYTKLTEVFALIGYPVAHSKSHITHNAVFKHKNIDAVYTKIEVLDDQFEEAQKLISFLDFSGLSVTMPLKQKVGGNTVRQSKVITTDGLGMLDAIEEKCPVKNKTMLILGAGATAASIAKEALGRGARIIIANRTESRAKALADTLGCTHVPWKSPLPAYDILIQATSIGMPHIEGSLPVTDADLHPHAIVADVISTQDTKLLQMAKAAGCTTIHGHEMWLRQAAHQFSFWKQELSPQEVLPLLKNSSF